MRLLLVLTMVVAGCKGSTPEPRVAAADQAVRAPESTAGAGTEPTPADPAVDAAPASPTEGAGGSSPAAAAESGCPEPTPGGREPDDRTGYFAPDGSPHPLACTVDGDCRPGPGVNPDDGCCDTGVANGVYGQAYLAWRAAWTQEHCAGHECPLLPPPAPPRPCALEGRCCAGRCQGRCPPF